MAARSVAIVGAGIGEQHLAAYLALPSRFRVAAVADPDAPRAAPLVAASDARYLPGLEEALDDPEVEIIDICLPTHMHEGAVLAALAAGKHAIVEKPLAASLAAADRIAAAEAASSASVFPVYQYRYGPAARQLSALIDAGIAGAPYAATLETHWRRDAAYYAVPWRGTWAGEEGGALATHAIHIHDWLSFAFGPIAALSATIATRVNPIETEDCAALTFEMESGALATSSVTLGAAQDETRLRFCFEGFTAESARTPYAPADGPWRFTAGDPARQGEIDATLAALPAAPSGFIGLFTAIADRLDGAPSDAPRLSDGRGSLEVITAAYASARIGARQALPLRPDHPLYQSWRP